MENKQSPSKKKLISIQEEKLIREVDYDCINNTQGDLSKTPYLLDLEIFPKNTNAQRKYSQKVLISVKPRSSPIKSIKTLYIAEKSRFHSKKGSSKSGSRLAIGDHSSFTTHIGGQEHTGYRGSGKSGSTEEDYSSLESKCSQVFQPVRSHTYNDKPRSAEKCYLYTQAPICMNIPKVEAKVDSSAARSKVDIATLIITNSSVPDSVQTENSNTLSKLHKRIEHLERKIKKQEMVFRSLEPDAPISSSEEETKDNVMKSSSGTGRPGCSYIQQYSHVPETSAFQRYANQVAPLSPSKATTIEKEHNSEQYGRDFTTYDGITARGRRTSASVPGKRDDVPKIAAERVHKIRHKLNPVRDYRLMDTVHYLAQGEFAPRDDGIKLTPSREAVLSDIIWEDVCRTHWPNTRLSRRTAVHQERYNTRGELQRLIDSLLRERVAHVERRRRRHYRIVKLNHRHESCRPVGKTGDIIVASHKNRHIDDNPMSDLNPGSARALIPIGVRDERGPRRERGSHDPFYMNDGRTKRRSRTEDTSPGPSRATTRPHSSRAPTCCYQTSTNPLPSTSEGVPKYKEAQYDSNYTSASSFSCNRPVTKTPRLIVKKDKGRRKQLRGESDLEHYIVLPTLVVRTPSNVKRQKKFNELYHKILNIQINSGTDQYDSTKKISETPKNPKTKDIGFNINITLSNSAEALLK